MRFGVLRVYGVVGIVILLSSMPASAFGARESEPGSHGVRAAHEGAVKEGDDVVVVGRIAVVGSEPITHLIVRTDAPGEEGRWALEIAGELAGEIFDHQNQVLRLEGVLDRVPAGAERGRIVVRFFSVPEQ